jgi:hypothetical protein
MGILTSYHDQLIYDHEHGLSLSTLRRLLLQRDVSFFWLVYGRQSQSQMVPNDEMVAAEPSSSCCHEAASYWTIAAASFNNVAAVALREGMYV